MQVERVAKLYSEILSELGEDCTREGLIDTPVRCAKAMIQLVAEKPKTPSVKLFNCDADQTVVVSGIKFSSLCEHHILPFTMNARIEYVTNGKMLGLSKFARICKFCAHGLNTQEEITKKIFDMISSLTESNEVCVSIVGRHSCMNSRGVCSNARTKTILKTNKG